MTALVCLSCGSPHLVSSLEARILDYIRRYWTAHRASPTYDEMQTALEVSSPGTLRRHIDRLVDRGALRRDPRKWRGIELTEPING